MRIFLIIINNMSLFVHLSCVSHHIIIHINPTKWNQLTKPFLWTSSERCFWALGVYCRTKCVSPRVHSPIDELILWFLCLFFFFRGREKRKTQSLNAHCLLIFVDFNLPDGCVFRSKWAFNNSNACGVNDVLRFRFFDGSTPMKSVKWFWPPLYRFQWLAKWIEIEKSIL